MSEDKFTIFRKEWSAFDSDADYFISHHDLNKLLRKVLIPLGFNAHAIGFEKDGKHGNVNLRVFVEALHLHNYHGQVFAYECAH
jgi:hypothetical protein